MTDSLHERKRTMDSHQKQQCPICRNALRRVHFKEPGTWCWNCEPYRPGAVILPAAKITISKIKADRAMLEIVKAFVFMAAGYAWAASAYGVFPRD
jgi:hypothetical protein